MYYLLVWIFFTSLTVYFRGLPMTGDTDLPHSYQYVRKWIVLMGNLRQLFVRKFWDAVKLLCLVFCVVWWLSDTLSFILSFTCKGIWGPEYKDCFLGRISRRPRSSNNSHIFIANSKSRPRGAVVSSLSVTHLVVSLSVHLSIPLDPQRIWNN